MISKGLFRSGKLPMPLLRWSISQQYRKKEMSIFIFTNWRNRRWLSLHRAWNLCRPRHSLPAVVGRVRVTAATGHVVSAHFAVGDHARDGRSPDAMAIS